jgi:hypothetical protein
MKNPFEVLKQKQEELMKVKMELSALYMVIPLIAEATDPKIDAVRAQWRLL